MSKQFYSAAEVAELLGIHQKTIQVFIREGKLKGTKIGRAWKIHVDDLKNYAHAELAPDPSQLSRSRASEDSLIPIDERVSVSAVIELKDAGEREISRITNTLIAVLNGKDPSWGKSRYDYFYEPETSTARFILYGKPAFISSILKMLEPLINEQEG